MDKQQYEATLRDPVAFRKDGDVSCATRPFLCVFVEASASRVVSRCDHVRRWICSRAALDSR